MLFLNIYSKTVAKLYNFGLVILNVIIIYMVVQSQSWKHVTFL